MNEGLLFELIRVAVGTQERMSCVPTVGEWLWLYQEASKHTVVGVCFAAVKEMKDAMPQDLYHRWLSEAAIIQRRNELMNRRCEELARRLSADGFRYCILKGQAAARYYGEMALLRQSGDIDVWMEGGRKRIMKYVESVGKTKEVILQHAHLNVFDDVEVEAHFYPSVLQSPWHNRRIQRWFRQQGKTELKFTDAGFACPSVLFDSVFMLSHIYKHLFSEGIGLRQVMDYYLMLRQAQFDAEEKRLIMEELDRFGMGGFAAGMMWVIAYIFMGEAVTNGNVDEKCQWLLCKPNETKGKRLLAEIMASGNFGHFDKRRTRKGGRIQRLIEPMKLTYGLSRDYPLEYVFTPINRALQRIWLTMHRYK